MNKKYYTLLLIGLFVLLIAACNQATAVSNSPGNPAANNGTPPSDRTLPETTQLVVGTFKLEETDLKVQAEQAAELLPLWQAYNTLSTSDTAAKTEIDALLTQIKATMTSEQMQAIADMKLTFQDMMDLNQSLGLTFGFGGRQNDQGTPQPRFGGEGFSGTPPEGFQGGGEGMRPPEGFQGGGFEGGGPGGGNFGQQGQSSDPSAQATREAFRSTRRNFDVNPMLIEALIKLLETKSGAGK